MTIHEKLQELKSRLRKNDRLAVAFSGGVDSAFLLKVAADTLGKDNVLAVTARAANFPRREKEDADALAGDLDVGHLHLDVDVMAIPGFAENSPDRCYFCKRDLFTAIARAAGERGIAAVADGANTDDDGDYRPGTRATRELGVISPLREAGLSKGDIRALSRAMGLPLWDKPAFACLASRIPYGQAITPEALERIEKAEAYFLNGGFRNVRVRLHGDVARIEVEPADRKRFFDEAFLDTTAAVLREMGFSYSALDLNGYRTGSLNEILEV